MYLDYQNSAIFFPVRTDSCHTYKTAEKNVDGRDVCESRKSTHSHVPSFRSRDIWFLALWRSSLVYVISMHLELHWFFIASFFISNLLYIEASAISSHLAPNCASYLLILLCILSHPYPHLIVVFSTPLFSEYGDLFPFHFSLQLHFLKNFCFLNQRLHGKMALSVLVHVPFWLQCEQFVTAVSLPFLS